MAGQALLQALGCIVVFHLTHHQRVVAGHLLICHSNVGLRRPGLLVLPRVADQETVERLAPAIEALHGMTPLELLDAQVHLPGFIFVPRVQRRSASEEAWPGAEPASAAHLTPPGTPPTAPRSAQTAAGPATSPRRGPERFRVRTRSPTGARLRRRS